jgi:hypothetical protein
VTLIDAIGAFRAGGGEAESTTEAEEGTA